MQIAVRDTAASSFNGCTFSLSDDPAVLDTTSPRGGPWQRPTLHVTMTNNREGNSRAKIATK